MWRNVETDGPRRSPHRGPRRGRRTTARLAGLAVAALTAAALALPAAAEEGLRTTPIEVGQAAPDFELQSSDGETYRLGEMKDRKSIVLIFFRGTW